MVWAGVWSHGRIGPIFIDGRLNGIRYEELLEEIWPQILLKMKIYIFSKISNYSKNIKIILFFIYMRLLLTIRGM